MQEYIIQEDIKVVCKRITTFPSLIKEGFDELARNYGMTGREAYGISRMDEQGNIIYMAAVTETEKDEAEKFGYTSFIIPKGEYLSETLRHWMQKTDQVKDVFGRLMQHPQFDGNAWCVEWYISDEEMLCLAPKK